MWIIGFSFVALVNLQNRNNDPFMGPDGDYVDIKKTFVFSILFFFISGNVVLR